MPTPFFTCPPPASLAAIPVQTCRETYDQIQVFFIQRIQTTPSFTTTNIILQATWTPLMAASDGTKIIRTPKIPNIVIPPSEINKEGGNDNTTLNGMPRVNGINAVPVTGMLENVTSVVRLALRALINESAINPGFSNLWTYPVNRFGQILGIVNGSNVEGIPFFNFIVGDAGTAGFNKPNMTNMSFDFPPGWSDGVQVFTPTAPFNPLNL